MKNVWTRCVALLLALLLLVPVCGCKPDEKDGNQDVFEPMEGEVPVDLNGYEFTVLTTGDTKNWNKEASGTPSADAWIQLIDEVEYLYNCKISATSVDQWEIFNAVQPEIAAGGKYADIVIMPQHRFGQFLGANLMLDLNELSVNWENEWWNQSIRKTTTYNNKSYLAVGSFDFDTNFTHLLYFNRAMWDRYGFEDPYELVDSGRWTYDVFREYMRTAAQDNDGSGELDSTEDVYGILAPDGDFCDAWFMAMGGHFFKAHEETGRVVLACNTSRTYEIVEKMYNVIQKDRVYGNTHAFPGEESLAASVQHFINGGALFYDSAPGMGGLQDMEDEWGVLPMPKFDEAQEEYLSSVDHNATVFGVTNTNDDLEEVSVVLEALGRHGMILEKIFWPDYKDTYWRDPESERIVSEYVVGHGQHDLSLIMASCGAAFSMPRDQLKKCVFGSAGSDYSSYIDMAEDAIEMQVQDFFGYDE